MHIAIIMLQVDVLQRARKFALNECFALLTNLRASLSTSHACVSFIFILFREHLRLREFDETSTVNMFFS